MSKLWRHLENHHRVVWPAHACCRSGGRAAAALLGGSVSGGRLIAGRVSSGHAARAHGRGRRSAGHRQSDRNAPRPPGDAGRPRAGRCPARRDRHAARPRAVRRIALRHRASLVDRRLSLILITMFLDVLGVGIIIPVAPFYAQAYGASALDVGLLFTFYSAAQFLATPVLGGLSDRYGRRSILLMSLIGEVVGYLMMGLADSLAALYLARIVTGATAGNIGAAQAYLADITRPEDRTRIFGLAGAAFGAGFLFGPALGGALSLIDLRLPAYAASGLVALNVIFVALMLPESLPVERRSTAPLRSQLNPLGIMLQLIERPILRAPLLVVFLLNGAFTGMQANLA